MASESKSRDRAAGAAPRGWAPVLTLTLTALAACAPAETAPAGADPVVTKIEGAPTAVATPVAHSDVTSTEPAKLLSSLHGAIALGTAAGLLTGTLADDPPAAVALVPDGGPTTTGAVDAVARRSGGGLLVHAASGLFHDTDGLLVPSPLEKSLAGKTIVAMDAFGDADAEELWIATTASAIHVGASKIETLDVDGASAPADAAIGVGPGQAVISAGGEAFFVDLTANTVKLLAKGLGKVHGHDRGEDSTVSTPRSRTRTTQGHSCRTSSPTSTPSTRLTSRRARASSRRASSTTAPSRSAR